MTSQELVVRQPPQYGAFEDTQEELEWYGSNPEGIDRDRTPKTIYPDEILDVAWKEEDDDNDSEGEWSRPTYSDASRSTSPKPSSPLHPPPSRHPPPSLKRKAPEASDDDDVVAPRKGSKRSKPVLVMSSEAVSTFTMSFSDGHSVGLAFGTFLSDLKTVAIYIFDGEWRAEG